LTDFLKDLSETFDRYGIVAESLAGQEVRSFQRSWLGIYAQEGDVEEKLANLKRLGLKPVTENIGKYATVGIDGAPAEEAYLKMPPQEIIVWQSLSHSAFICQIGNSLPLFTSMPCGSRWTVAASDLSWAAVLPGMCCAGQAFFALSEWQHAAKLR
jgi:hypothetical protein